MVPSTEMADGRILGKRRRRIGISQEVLSRLAELSTYTLGQIENERRPVKVGEWTRLNAVLVAFEAAHEQARKVVTELLLAS